MAPTAVLIGFYQKTQTVSLQSASCDGRLFLVPKAFKRLHHWVAGACKYKRWQQVPAAHVAHPVLARVYVWDRGSQLSEALKWTREA